MSIEFGKEKEKHICIGVGCARKKMFVISKICFFLFCIFALQLLRISQYVLNNM